jgi:hypothetical protein
MSYQFTMVLSREINDDESAALRAAGCPEAALTSAALPTDASLTVTQLDFNTEGPSLAEVLAAALESVKAVPDLSAASLSVPPHPDEPADRAADSAPQAAAVTPGIEMVELPEVETAAAE